MDKKKIGILTGLIVVLLVVSYIFFLPKKEKEKEEEEKALLPPKGVKKKMSPYSTYILYRLMEDFEPTKSIRMITRIDEDVLPTKQKNGNPNLLIYINEDAYFDYRELQHILDFVRRGNHVFISVEYLDESFYSEFFTASPFSYTTRDTLEVNFYHFDLTLKKYHKLVPYPSTWNIPKTKYTWNTLDAENIYNYHNPVFISHTDESDPVCCSFSLGKGSVTLHSVPLAFSNLNLTSEMGVKYAERIFSHIPGSNIYWYHNKNKYSPIAGAKKIKEDPEKSFLKKRSQLQYILENPYFSTSFYILLTGVLFYFIFQSKRRQRVIPPIEKVENTTRGFVKSVSHLYYQQGRHDKLLAQKEKQLLHFIKQRYYLSTPKPDEAFYEKVAAKSGITKEEISALFTSLLKGVENPALSATDMVNIHQKIETFYKNCK